MLFPLSTKIVSHQVGAVGRYLATKWVRSASTILNLVDAGWVSKCSQLQIEILPSNVNVMKHYAEYLKQLQLVVFLCCCFSVKHYTEFKSSWLYYVFYELHFFLSIRFQFNIKRCCAISYFTGRLASNAR